MGRVGLGGIHRDRRSSWHLVFAKNAHQREVVVAAVVGRPSDDNLAVRLDCQSVGPSSVEPIGMVSLPLLLNVESTLPSVLYRVRAKS